MKRTPLTRSRRRSRTVGERTASALFGQGGPCELAGDHDCDGPVQSHHVVSKEKLRKMGRPDLLWDVRNRLRLCRHRHERHTSAVERVRIDQLPAEAVAFAREIGLEWWLERFYA